MKEGDTVLVDVGRPNGGYEAEIIWLGKYFAMIKLGNDELSVMKSRLTPKQQTT